MVELYKEHPEKIRAIGKQTEKKMNGAKRFNFETARQEFPTSRSSF
jgi:hypothetical protein